MARGMRIVRLDPADSDAMRGCYEVHKAAAAIDDPHEPPMSLPVFSVWLSSGWDGNPGEVWYAPGEDPGEVIACFRLDLPDLENLDRAALQYLAGCRFAAAPSGRESAWGTATFLWGADVRQGSQQWSNTRRIAILRARDRNEKGGLRDDYYLL